MKKLKKPACAAWIAALLLTTPLVPAVDATAHSYSSAPKRVAAAKLSAPLPLKHGIGTYNGLADGHTVEIEVYGEPTSFQFGEDLKTAAASLEEGESVEYVYTEQRLAGHPEVRLLTLAGIKARTRDEGANNVIY